MSENKREALRAGIRGFLQALLPSLVVFFNTVSASLANGEIQLQLWWTVLLSLVLSAVAGGIAALDKYVFKKTDGENGVLPKLDNFIPEGE